MRLLRASLIMTVATLWARPSEATSCRWMDDHFLLLCDGSRCTPLFRAVEVPAYGLCGRRMMMEPFPRWAQAPIVEIVRDSIDGPSLPLVVSVALRHRFPIVPRTADRLRDAWEEPRVLEHAEQAGEVRTWYEPRCSADSRRHHLLIGRDLAAYAGALALLVGSLGWLIRGLIRAQRGATDILLRALGIKVGLMVAGVGLVFVFPRVPPFLLLLAPAALLFALLDLIAFAALRRRREKPMPA